MNNYFDKILCINLEHRTDRWEVATKLFAEHNLKVERVLGVNKNNIKLELNSWFNNGRLACTLSHLYCLKYMVNNNIERLFVFEDDVEFAEDFDNKIKNVLENLPEDFDMLYLGGNLHNVKNVSQVNDYLNLSEGILTTHAYGISLKYAKYIIPKVEALNDVIDCVYMANQPNFNIYISREVLCSQSDGFSDIENKVVDYKFLR